MAAMDNASGGAYSPAQITSWLRHISLPEAYMQYVDAPHTFPKTADGLLVLFRSQITTFPYENLSVHYSLIHQVNIKPEALYDKMMGARELGRGGYCMELSIFFHHMLRGLGFDVYMTGVRNRTRTDGVPAGEYQGWTHINNIVHLPCGTKYSADVAFGGDGPTSPLRMDDDAQAVQNLGPQEVRLIHDNIPKQRLPAPKLWIYQYRNDSTRNWNSFYSFPDLEFFQEDFEVQNWWASARTLHRWTVLLVRFLRQGEPLEFGVERDAWVQYGRCKGNMVTIVGKVMLVNDVVKVNMGGQTQLVQKLGTEEERLQAFVKYFGISLSTEESRHIHGWDMALTY